MEDDIFSVTDVAIAKAGGSHDPVDVAEANGIFVAEPLSDTITGMSMRFSYLGSIAVNGKLDTFWRMFTYWHELGHVFRKHVDDPAFNFHQDVGVFTQPVDSMTIPMQEKEANLISAEYNIPTDDVLELIGYNSRAMRDYRDLKKRENEMCAMNCMRSLSEIAGELGANEVIIKYKLEAMRFRGYDIDVQELEQYDQIFKEAR